jgi:hypothetical protein
MQIKSMSTCGIAVDFGRKLFEDMSDAANKVKGMAGVTVGTLTPAARFVSDPRVPECTRFTVTDKVLKFSPTATDEELDVMSRAMAAQAKKRARLVK